MSIVFFDVNFFHGHRNKNSSTIYSIMDCMCIRSFVLGTVTLDSHLEHRGDTHTVKLRITWILSRAQSL